MRYIYGGFSLISFAIFSICLLSLIFPMAEASNSATKFTAYGVELETQTTAIFVAVISFISTTFFIGKLQKEINDEKIKIESEQDKEIEAIKKAIEARRLAFEEQFKSQDGKIDGKILEINPEFEALVDKSIQEATEKHVDITPKKTSDYLVNSAAMSAIAGLITSLISVAMSMFF